MKAQPSPRERTAFYSAAALGLRALDARESSPRRFGRDAEARWAQFKGELRARDRIDILLRDAAVTWGAAFSPAECFGVLGLADDDPFGPEWGGIDEGTATRLLSDAPPDIVAGENVATATIDALAAALDVEPRSVAVPAIAPATKLAIAGGGAIVAVAKIFADDRALSWSDQIVVIADAPAFRQLAGLMAVIVGARGRTALLRTGADQQARPAGFLHLDAAVIADDAEPAAAACAQTMVGR